MNSKKYFPIFLHKTRTFVIHDCCSLEKTTNIPPFLKSVYRFKIVSIFLILNKESYIYDDLRCLTKNSLRRF